jgi:hypothetical protein
MKLIALVLFLLPSACFSQVVDTFNFVYYKKALEVPLTDDRIVYSKIAEFDSSNNADKIYHQIKPAISKFFVSPGVGNQYNMFQFQNIKDQVISEDKENRTIFAHLIFKPLRGSLPANSIKEDMVIVCKGRFIVRNNKLKVVISDINIYYNSTAAAILVGTAYSLVTYSLDDLYKSRKKKDKKTVTKDSELGKACFTALFKIENFLIGDIIEQVGKGLKQDDF